ncbi:MAG: hypothetical protein COB33_009970 [Thiotrichaceae bacterium]|nr:hypothetical protein [Thiotrichaceae bacterium]
MIRKIFVITGLTLVLLACEKPLLPGQILAPDPLPVATDVTATEIKRFIEALPRDAVTDSAIRVVEVTGDYRIGVYGVYRPKDKASESNLHQVNTTEIYYMLAGSGTLVTGGEMISPKRASPASITLKGAGIKGGVSRRVGPGDVVIIPGYTPHWWSELTDDLSYIIFRTDPDNRIELQ